MSRKSIQILLPASAPPAPVEAKKVGAADSWVTQAQDATPVEVLGQPAPQPLRGPEGLTITVRLTPQFDPFEAAKIFIALPQAAWWFWSFGLAQNAMSLPLPRVWRR